MHRHRRLVFDRTEQRPADDVQGHRVSREFDPESPVSPSNFGRGELLSSILTYAARAPRHRAPFAILLTAVAGFLDAVGYIELQHLYVSFMSGNSTHLGMSLAAAHWRDAFDASVIIGTFVLGALGGTLIADASQRFVTMVVLNTELGLLLLAAALTIGDYDRIALILVALTMGMQNTLRQVVSGADLGKTFITGVLFAIGQSMARWFRSRTPFVQVRSNILSWTAFIVGAVLGALTLTAFGLALALCVIVITLSIVIALTCLGWF